MAYTKKGRKTTSGKGNAPMRKFNRNRNNYRIIIYVAIAAVVITAAVVLSMTVLFKIDNITVDIGEGVPYTAEEIVDQCSVKIGDNLFASPMGDAADGITCHLPYIEQCRISRRLPSTIVIHTGAAKVLGVAPTGDDMYTVISTGGRVIDVVTGETAKQYIRLEGIDASTAEIGYTLRDAEYRRAEIALDIISGLDKHGIALQSVSFAENGYVSAMYDGRVELVFGSISGLEDKITLAAALLEEGKITKNESGRLDLSIEGRATFRPDYLN